MKNAHTMLIVSITKLKFSLSIVVLFFEICDKITASKRHYTSEATKKCKKTPPHLLPSPSFPSSLSLFPIISFSLSHHLFLYLPSSLSLFPIISFSISHHLFFYLPLPTSFIPLSHHPFLSSSLPLSRPLLPCLFFSNSTPKNRQPYSFPLPFPPFPSTMSIFYPIIS